MPEKLFRDCYLVLVAHDEMVAQVHDGLKYTWVLNGKQPLRKKGVGRGLHQSDFICSTVGWLEEASVTLKYGKNHEGMWTGELFAKQGHSSYAPDALHAGAMNLKPGGKQARMCAGWFTNDGQKVIQSMIYGPDHEMYANQAKGICKKRCEEDATDCCVRHIIQLQPDFMEQKS
ncbi:hypothetical protein GYMLUDRAFT_65233 [Collybiopsis luxurians FD-317 M1]|uniref:Uncharacterized protein n=1 Tax=Collybiopsis luxurians FD-317 M1 TaxID=944289 RepID=A0A0D0BM94_9AGAR|nr:hypothetical protein GYMLUDRAFT_65233 [Collybiopsis luxurians FD-317 M1]